MSQNDTESSKTRAQEIRDMLSSIPIELLRARTIELLSANRTVSMGRDREPVTEPDNAIRAKVLLACIEQSDGRPAAKPSPPAPKAQAGDKPTPGMLKAAPKVEAGPGE